MATQALGCRAAAPTRTRRGSSTRSTRRSAPAANLKHDLSFRVSSEKNFLNVQNGRSCSSVRGGVLTTCLGRTSTCQERTARSARKVSTHALAESVDEEAASSQPVKHRRAVITGMGVVSSLGHDVDEFYENLLAGKSGVKPIAGFDAGELSTTIAGEITDFEPGSYITPKMARRLDPYIKYILVAAKKALQHGKLWDPEETLDVFESLDKNRCGAMVGSAMGGYQTFAKAINDLDQKGPRKMNPFCIPFAITNMGSAILAMDLGFMGPNYSMASACATGSHSILGAVQHIQRGECDVMLAGASDACILPIGMAGFQSAQALSKRNDDPEGASRPWDTDRDGFVMGEGAGVLCIEELEHARARGAKIYAEVLGGAFNSDAHHMTNPHPDGLGVASCIEDALKDAGVSPDQVNYVNAHATSTPAGDLAEYKALKKALQGADFKMNSTKSLIGHLLGAAGAVEAVAVCKAIETGRVHPNLNVNTPEPDLDLNDIVGSTSEQMDIKVALSNSFGFGGNNACLVFAPFEE